MLEKMKHSIQNNWKHATLEFTFILLFMQAFQAVFGPENSVVAIIFTIMMAASMVRDMTAAPIKHLLIQAATLVMMAASACFANALGPAAGFAINLATIFIIVYAYTYEYASHMYFPYILSYLFLLYIGPVPPQQLPKRLLGMLAGAVCIILYQFFKGRRRVAETARDVLVYMTDEALSAVDRLLAGEEGGPDPDEVRHNLCKLSRTVFERRKRALQVSDASFSMVDAGRGLEHLILLLKALRGPLTPERAELLTLVSRTLGGYRDFLLMRAPLPPPPGPEDCARCGAAEAGEFLDALGYIRDHLLHMTDPDRRTRCRPTALSLKVRLLAALDVSAVRVAYAARVAVLLAVFALAVRLLALPHGKWLMFTLASVSLPYADDVGAKAKNRLLATLAGGACSLVLYALIPGTAARTFIMMASGYLNFFFSAYTGTYSCATIGALGGAVVAGTFGWAGVGSIVLIRLCYIALGAAIALLVNCAVLPFRRRTATRLLVEKYTATTALLTRICREEEVDPQLYYDLVIQAHLQEDKLAENAAKGGWEAEIRSILTRCRASVREAHRVHRSGYASIGSA